VEYEGRTLADGCIVAPVPTIVAAQFNTRCVLGVTVNSGVGSASFANKLTQGPNRAFETLNGKKNSPSWTRKADVMLEPDVQGIDWNDFSRVDEAFAAGVDAMRRALPLVREFLARRSEQMVMAGIPGNIQNRMVS
jgi:NTE family protein